MKELLDFLSAIKESGSNFFIEAEGRPKRIDNFLKDYNRTHHPVNKSSDGIICLQEDADKWGLELRLYVPVEPPSSIRRLFTRNMVYRVEYRYRLNDNNLIKALFEMGFTIGLN